MTANRLSPVRIELAWRPGKGAENPCQQAIFITREDCR
jgi:hypothetical protein